MLDIKEKKAQNNQLSESNQSNIKSPPKQYGTQIKGTD